MEPLLELQCTKGYALLRIPFVGFLLYPLPNLIIITGSGGTVSLGFGGFALFLAIAKMLKLECCSFNIGGDGDHAFKLGLLKEFFQSHR